VTTIAPNPDRLYNLLPALYRISDAEHDEQLRMLLELVTAEADALRNGTEQLWNDFFIETCDDWVIPYIGDLVGNLPLHDLDAKPAAETAESLFKDLAGPDLVPAGAIPTRADVARTIYYRRRKGTPAMLEELARDVTGWGAHVVEFLSRLDWNQHLEHLRFECEGCPDLHRVDVGERVGGAWDSTMHTVDVRPINEWDGWYAVSNIGFFLWRLVAFPATHVTPRAIGGTTWRLTFSPLGQNTPLLSPGSREPGPSGIATELTVPLPIRPAAFYEDLSAASPPLPGADLLTGYYGDPSIAAVAVYTQTGPAAYTQINDVACMNLERWSTMAQPAGSKIFIDPTRGRLVIPAGLSGQTIVVSYHYGFSAPLGGGEYGRAKWLAVPEGGAAVATITGGGPNLDNAVSGRAAGQSIFEIADNATYDLTTAITVHAGESLVIQAADSCRPCIQVPGALQITSSGAKASLTLGGLLVAGGLDVTGDLSRLRLLHTTLLPGRSVVQETVGPSGPSITVHHTSAAGRAINAGLEVQIAFSIVGALRLPATIAKLWLLDSIVDGIEKDGDDLDGGAFAVCDDAKKSGPLAHIERSTLLGRSLFRKLELASDSILFGGVDVDERQAGCVRFSYVSPDSKTPQRYRCQPSLEIDTETAQTKAAALKSGTTLPAGWDTAQIGRAHV